MSQESVEWIIGKIVLDARFRESLLADPDQALSAFDLTEREKAGFKCLDSETMEAVAKTLADRLAQVHNFGDIFSTPQQTAALQARLEINAGDFLDSAEVGSGDSPNRIGNVGHLKL